MAEGEEKIEPGNERFVNKEEAAEVGDALTTAMGKEKTGGSPNDPFGFVSRDEPTVPTISTQERLKLQGIGMKLEPVKVEKKPSGVVSRIRGLFGGK